MKRTSKPKPKRGSQVDASSLSSAELARRMKAVIDDTADLTGCLAPWVEMPPVADFLAVMTFDRATCDRGLTRYLRRHDASEAEFLATVSLADLEEVDAVLVIEVARGLRARVGIAGVEHLRAPKQATEPNP